MYRLKEVLFMNNKGQSLIVFVLFLPIIIFFLALFIDASLMMLEKNRISSIIKDNMQIALNKDIKDYDKIKKAILSNDEKLTVNVLVTDELRINVTDKKKNLFGNILKFEWYNENYCFSGNYENKEIKKC